MCNHEGQPVGPFVAWICRNWNCSNRKVGWFWLPDISVVQALLDCASCQRCLLVKERRLLVFNKVAQCAMNVNCHVQSASVNA